MPDSETTPKRKQIGARVEADLLTEVRILALRQERQFNELLEEALKDLLKKYREKKRT